MRHLFFALALLVAVPAQAAITTLAPHGVTATKYLDIRNGASTNTLNLLEAVALNAAAASRTITIPTGRKWGKLRVFVFYTYAAATTVTAVFSCSLDGVTYGTLQSRGIVAGASTVSSVTDTKTTSAADQDYSLEYDVRGCASVKVIFAGASGGASDLIDVQAVAVGG